MRKVQGITRKNYEEGAAYSFVRGCFFHFFAMFVAFVLLSLCGGCKTPTRSTPGGDPLLGGGAPLPRNPGKQGPGPTQGTAGTGQGGQPQASIAPPVPALPTAGPGASPAALATGRRQPFDPERDLKINDWPRTAPGSTGGWNTAGNPARSNGSGVTLRPPEPLQEGNNVSPSPANYAAPESRGSVPSGANTRESNLAQRLQTLGAVYQYPERLGPTDWQFTCAVRNPNNPAQQRVYQSRGRDVVEAMQSVLQRIEGERP